MNSRRFDYTISFNADTEKAKKQIESLQNQVNSLVTQGLKQSFSMPDFSKATKDITNLSIALKNSVDESGKLNLTKFNQSLNTSGLTAEKLKNSMAALGPAGEKAFYSLTDSVLNAEVALKRTNTLLSKFSQTLINTAKWQISSNIMHGLQSGLQQAYSYAQNLDKSLNNIRIVTGYSADQMADFAKNANNAAKALHSSTLAYTDAALIYYQQGLTGKEITERTNATIKLSNVTGDTVETVSNQLTAVWNNFADGSKNLEYYVDVMTALGTATASSTDEIATGLEKFAAIAETTGLSYEYATSALATVTAKTRQSAEVVGTAFKTLFARIQDLELGKTLEDGTSLGIYSQALATIGVNIKNQNGELKEMDQILDEMGSKWSKLGRAEQASLAQTVAGTRQYTQLIALMDNWDFFKENVNTARGSAGTLEAQAQIYAESWEAANKKVKASAEEIYSSLINDKFFIKLTNFFGDALNVLDNIIDGVGGLKGILAIVSAILMKTFSKQMTENFTAFGRNMALAGEGLKNGKTFGEKIKGGWKGITGRAAEEQGIAQREEFLNAAISLRNRQVANQNGTGHIDALNDIYLQRFDIQQQILKNGESLTVEEQEQLKILQDQLQVIGQQYDKELDRQKMFQMGESVFYNNLDEDTQKKYNDLKKDLNTSQIYHDAGHITANFNEKYKEISEDKTLSTEERTAKLDSLATDFETALRRLIDSMEGVEGYEGIGDKLHSDIYENDYIKKFREGKLTGGDFAGVSEQNNLNIKQLEKELSEDVVQQANRSALMSRNVQNSRLTTIEASAYAKGKAQSIQDKKDKEAPQKDFGKAASAVSMSLMSLSAAFSAAESVISTWSDETKSFGEKLTSTTSSLTTVGFSIMQASSQLKYLGLNAKQSAASIIALLALIGSIRFVGFAVDKAQERNPEKKIQKIREEYEKNKEILQENIDAYDDLNKSIESLGDQADSINKLTKGTTDWYLAISKSNNQLVELLKTYKLLNKEYYKIDNNGLYSLTEKGEAALKGAAFKQAQTAQQSMALNEIALSQQTQTANNQAFAKNNDIATAWQRAGTFGAGMASASATGLGMIGGAKLGALAGGAVTAATAGGAAAAAGAAFGSIVPVIGTLIGAAIGLGLGIIGTTKEIEYNNQQLGNFAEQVADTMNETGATLEDPEFAEKMESLGYTVDETAEAYLKEIKSNKKARDAMDEFAASVAQAKAQQDMYWQQLAESNLQSDSYYNSLNTDTEKSDYVKITAQALKAATEKAYDKEYRDKGKTGGGMTDEEIQRAYAKAIGWTFVKDLGNNMGRYMDNEGKEQEVSDEVARRYLASIDKNTQYQAKEIARNIKNLETKSKEENNVFAKLLYNVASGQGVDGLTKSDINQLGEGTAQDILRKLGISEKEWEDSYGSTIEELEKVLKQSVKAFNEIYLVKQGLGIPDGWTYGIAQNISDQFRAVEDMWGKEAAEGWYTSVKTLREKLVKAAGDDEDLLTKINNLDFSKINEYSTSFWELLDKLDLAPERIDDLVESLKALDTTTVEVLNSITKSGQGAVKKARELSVGDTLDEADYNKLPDKLKPYFSKNFNGEYVNINEIPQWLADEASRQNVQAAFTGREARKSAAENSRSTAKATQDSLGKREDLERKASFTSEDQIIDDYGTQDYTLTFSQESLESFQTFVKNKADVSSEIKKMVDNFGLTNTYNEYAPYFKDIEDLLVLWQNEIQGDLVKWDEAQQVIDAANNIIDNPYSDISDSTVYDLASYNEYASQLDQVGGLDDKEKAELKKDALKKALANERYAYINNQYLVGNISEEQAVEQAKMVDAKKTTLDFVDSLTELQETMSNSSKDSEDYRKSLEGIAVLLNNWIPNLNLSAEDVEKLDPSLLKEAINGSTEALAKLRIEAVKTAGLDKKMPVIEKAFFGNDLENIREEIYTALIKGEQGVYEGVKNYVESKHLDNWRKKILKMIISPLLKALELTMDENYNINIPAGTDVTGGATKEDKLNSEIDKLNSRRSALQSKMEHAYDEARRDMEKQEIGLVDQLIAKQKALLAITTDAAQKESILAEIESLRSERESLELDAIKNKYQEIEQLLKNQKSLYEDLADIKKAQGATDLEQLQSEIEGLNFALTDIILAGKNFEEARAYYENHQNDKHAIEQYQEAIVNLSSAQAAFWKTRESITNEINSILDKSDEKINNYIDGLDHIAEGFKNLNDILKSSIFFLSLDEKVLTNINKLTKEANKLTLDNSKNILTARIAERKTYQENIKGYKSQLADPTLSAEDRAMYEEYLKTAEEKLQSVEDSIQATWKDSLDLVNSIFEESVDEAIKNFEDSVSSYSSLENLKKAFDFQKEESDQVLDSVTQTYELSKLSRTIAQEIGNKTSLKAQNSLKNLLEEINQIQKDKTQLSEQELKNLQQRYDLRLAEIALEEAQWNKTQMRLQRNANGTWSYTYGSTNEDLIKAQQNLEDKQQEIYKTSSEMVDNMSEKLISSLQSYSSGMQDIAKKVASGEMTAEQAEEAYRLNRNYLKQATNYAKQLEKALSYANINYIDTDLAKATGTKTLADLMSNITDATEKLDTDVSDALNNLIFQTRDLFQTAEFDINNTSQIIAQAQVASIEKTKDMNKATEELSNTMDGLNKKIDDFRNMWANMSGYIAKSFETIDQLIERLEKIGKNLTGFGDFDIESISKNNNNKNNSNWSSNTTGTKSFVKYDPDVDYAALYKKARNAGASQATLNQILAQRNRKVDEVNAAGGNAKKLTGDEIMALDTGGYTGDWGSDGKLAILHEKELVLNKEDTANILNAVNAVRSLSSGILKDIFANSGFLMDLLSGMSSAPSINPNGQLEQNVRIEASFPNVSSKDEIEAAFTDLVNQAAQFASIKNL